MKLRRKIYIKMENIFENLDVSEECFDEILIRVFEAIENSDTSIENKKKRIEGIVRAIQKAKNGKYRTKAIRVYGIAQNNLNKAQDKNKEDVKNSGITFTPKAFN